MKEKYWSIDDVTKLLKIFKENYGGDWEDIFSHFPDKQEEEVIFNFLKLPFTHFPNLFGFSVFHFWSGIFPTDSDSWGPWATFPFNFEGISLHVPLRLFSEVCSFGQSLNGQGASNFANF